MSRERQRALPPIRSHATKAARLADTVAAAQEADELASGRIVGNRSGVQRRQGERGLGHSIANGRRRSGVKGSAPSGHAGYWSSASRGTDRCGIATACRDGRRNQLDHNRGRDGVSQHIAEQVVVNR
jgi:hypothetical protein